MAQRFQRGHQAGITFFAFQDIITAVGGIMVVITLMLALNLESGEETAFESNPDMAAKLQTALEELTALRGKIAGVQRAEQASDPAAFSAEVSLLQAQAAALEKRREQLRAELKATGKSAATLTSVSGSRAQMEQLAKSVEQLRQKAAVSQSAMKALEEQVKQQETALAGELDRKNILRVIPDRSTTTKEPILILVSAQTISLQRFDAGELASVRKESDLKRELGRLSKLDQYLVFYFKPSGAERFQELTEAARDAGYEIGYDAIPEDFHVEFRSAPARAPAPVP